MRGNHTSRPTKSGIARLGDALSNVAAGKLRAHEYARQRFPPWNAGPGDFVLVDNIRISVGTDGGTGITFASQLEVEFEALHHFGFTPAEILQMATVGNMKTLRHDDEFGSIEPGKHADLVVLGKNPLDGVRAIQDVRKVFKRGRLVFSHYDRG